MEFQYSPGETKVCCYFVAVKDRMGLNLWFSYLHLVNSVSILKYMKEKRKEKKNKKNKTKQNKAKQKGAINK